jgi:hypothetical protein
MKYIDVTRHKHALAVLGVLTLTACGGGGSSEVEPTVDTSQPALTANTGITLPQAATAAVAPSTDAQSSAPSSDVVAAATVNDLESPYTSESQVIEPTADSPAPPVDLVEAPDATVPSTETATATQVASATSPSAGTEPTLLAGATFVAGANVAESFDGTSLTGFGTAVVNHKHAYLVSGKGVNGSKAIKVNYVGNSEGSERVIVNYRIPRALQYTLNFDVNFCSGFDFAKGGKLHGLGPANPVAGGNDVTSARWSARGMFKSLGGLQSYIYSQNMRSQYGDVVIARDFKFQPGRYYAITYQVGLNNPATMSNGFMKVYVDGRLLITHSNIKFRSTSAIESEISTLMFNTFHGGHTSEWAPRNADGSYATDCAYYDNFAAYPFLRVRTAPGT